MTGRTLVLLLAAATAMLAFMYLFGTVIGWQQVGLVPARPAIEDAPNQAETAESSGPTRPLPADQPTLAGRAPILVEPPILDLGTIGDDRAISATAHLRNTSGEPQRIATHRVSCACLSADVPQHDIPPHGSVPVTLTFDPSNRSGRQSVGLRVVFEGYDEPVVVILRAFVGE